MKRIVLNFIIFMSFVSCGYLQQKQEEPEQSGWTAVFKNGEDGIPIEGNIDSLIYGIRNGYDVRVGWGWENQIGDSLVRLEHMAKPLYISIIQEKNVSAIIDPHPLLTSYFDISKQKFREGGHSWQCVLTTRGEFNAQVYDRSTGELLRDWPQKQVITWFLEYPVNRKKNREPLFRK